MWSDQVKCPAWVWGYDAETRALKIGDERHFGFIITSILFYSVDPQGKVKFIYVFVQE